MILYLSCTIEGLDVVINFSVLLQPNVTVFREVKQLSLYQCHYSTCYFRRGNFSQDFSR